MSIEIRQLPVVIGPLIGAVQMLRRHVGPVAAVFLLGLGACERQSPQAVADEGQSPAVATHPNARIVSLAPALTQIIKDMGCHQTLVGVGENDFASPQGVRVVGQFMNINTEALIKLRPTHVVAMYGRGGAPAYLLRLARSHHFQLLVYDYPKRVDQVLRMLYRQEDFTTSGPVTGTRSLAKVLDAPELGRRAWVRMRDRLAGIRTLTRDRPKPSVLIVFATSPIMASGPGTVLHDLLETCAGGRNAAHESAVSAPTFDREKLLKLQPQVILLLLPREPPLRALGDDPRLAALHDLPIPAVQHGRIVLINDPLAVLPASSLPRIAAAMARVLHPDLVPQIDAIMRDDPT